LVLSFSSSSLGKAKEDEVRIGLHGPFSAPVAYSGELMKKGFLLAVEEINKARGG